MIIEELQYAFLQKEYEPETDIITPETPIEGIYFLTHGEVEVICRIGPNEEVLVDTLY